MARDRNRLICPHCDSDNIRRSHRINLRERALNLVLISPYRCKDCRQRFWKFDRSFGRSSLSQRIRASNHKTPEYLPYYRIIKIKFILPFTNRHVQIVFRYEIRRPPANDAHEQGKNVTTSMDDDAARKKKIGPLVKLELFGKWDYAMADSQSLALRSSHQFFHSLVKHRSFG